MANDKQAPQEDLTMTDSKQSAPPKKSYPSFWKALKHPSPDTSALPLPNPSLDLLTEQQKSTYDFIVNTLSSPDFELPVTASASSSQNVKEDPPVEPGPPLSNKLSQAERCYCSREAILRVCRATKWDQHRALKRLVDTLVWRREFGVDQIDHCELSHEAETGKQFTLGYDNHQRPILYMFPYRQNTKPSINQIKLLVWYLERTIDLMPPGVETLTLIIDFGTSEKTRNSNSQPTPISIAKEVLKILQTYYCERLAQAICINVPWVFWGFLKLLRPFMDPKTSEKVVFDPTVTDHVPAEQLLQDAFNGALDFDYNHEVYFKLFAELTANRKRRMLARYARYGQGMIGMGEYELRGGNRPAKARREQSIGTTSTIVSCQTNESAVSSAAAGGTHSSPTIADGPSRGSPGTIASKDPSSSHHSEDLALQSAGETIASRPLSPHSLSPSSDERNKSVDQSRAEPPGSKARFLFRPFHSKSAKTNRAAMDPSGPSPTACSSPSLVHSSRNSSISTSRPSPSNPRRQTISHPHQFQTLNAFGSDEHGRLLQPDHMSCSRRISRVCS